MRRWRSAPPLLDCSGTARPAARLASDTPPLSHAGGTYGGEVEVPVFGNAVICGSAAALEVGAAAGGPGLDDGGRLFGVGGEFGRKLRFNPMRFVQFDQPLATHGLDRVPAVGDDQHVGGEGGRAKSGKGHRQRNGQAEGSPTRREPRKRRWHETGK